MKKLSLLKTVLLLCALIVGSSSVWADDSYVKVTSSSDLVAGEEYILLETSNPTTSYLANTTWSSSKYGSETSGFSIDGNTVTVTTGTAALVLRLGGSEDAWTLYDVENEKWVGKHTSSNTNFIQTSSESDLTKSQYKWTIKTKGSEYAIYSNYSSYTGRYWGRNNNAIGPYDGNSYPACVLYKKASAKTATTTTITSTGITNTEINKGTAAGSLSAAVTVTEGGASVAATVTWTSSDESVATIASNGAVTLVGVGSTNLKATYAGDETYAGSNATYKLTVTDSRADAGLSFDEASYTCDKFDSFAAPTLNTADEFDGTPVYESSDESVATVDSGTGEVTILAVGTTTISVHSDATTNFQAGDAEYELTVTIHDGLDPVDPAGVGRYVKVTSTEDITDGNYLIVYEGDETHDAVAFDGSRETLDVVGNTIEVEISEGVIAATDETNAAVFTIDVTAGTIKSASGYYIGRTSNGNGLNQSENADAYTNTFAISEGAAVITTDNNCVMKYNFASDQRRFRFYGSSQKPIQLYKYEAGSAAKVTLSADGYKTMVGTQPFSASGANIYIVTSTDTEKATMTKITKAPADEPVILKGAANADVTLTVESTGDDASGNLLEVSTESTGNGVYVLAKKDDVVAFYEWDGGSLGTGRVYLPKPASGDAREMISFFFEDEETTGINTTLTTNERMNNEVYNLNGQRVAQPTKGLYIVNGKKYIVK